MFLARFRNKMMKLISWDSSFFQRNLSDCTMLLVGRAVLDLPGCIKGLYVFEAATLIGLGQDLLARSIYFTGKLTDHMWICIIHAVKSVGSEELRRSSLKRSHGLKPQARQNSLLYIIVIKEYWYDFNMRLPESTALSGAPIPLKAVLIVHRQDCNLWHSHWSPNWLAKRFKNTVGQLQASCTLTKPLGWSSVPA